MVPDPIQVAGIRKPSDPSANKPTYLVTVEAPDIPGKVAFYRTKKLDKFDAFVRLTGFALTKTQANKLRKNPNASEVAEREINIEFPWHRVISIENTTHKKKVIGDKNV